MYTLYLLVPFLFPTCVPNVTIQKSSVAQWCPCFESMSSSTFAVPVSFGIPIRLDGWETGGRACCQVLVILNMDILLWWRASYLWAVCYTRDSQTVLTGFEDKRMPCMYFHQSLRREHQSQMWHRDFPYSEVWIPDELMKKCWRVFMLSSTCLYR